MATLLELPTELLECVFQQLDQRSLLRLARCSRGLKPLAERHGYRHIELAWKKDRSCPDVLCLLRVLIRRPHLAQCTRTIDLWRNRPGHPSGRRWQDYGNSTLDRLSNAVWGGSGTPADIDPNAYQQFRRAITVAIRSTSRPHSVDDDSDILISLAISNMCNLKVLRVSSRFFPFPIGGYIGEILPLYVTSKWPMSTLACLEEVILCNDLHEIFTLATRIDGSVMSALLQLPRLKRLRASLSGGVMVWPSVDTNIKSHVTVLELCWQLTALGVVDEGLLVILGRTPNLVELKLHVAIDGVREDWGNEHAFLFASHGFVQAVAQVAPTLRRMSLSSSSRSHCGDCVWPSNNPAYRPYNDLAHPLRLFIALEDLEIPIVYLFGWTTSADGEFVKATTPEAAPLIETLPFGIRNLTLRVELPMFETLEHHWYDDDILARLRPYLQSVKPLELALETLTLKVVLMPHDFFHQTHKPIMEEECEAAGVSFKMLVEEQNVEHMNHFHHYQPEGDYWI